MRRVGLLTRPTWPGRRLAVPGLAVARLAAGPVARPAAVAAGVAAGVLLAAAVLGGWRDQLFLDPAPLAGSGLWWGQKCPRFQLLGPTRLPGSVVEMAIDVEGWPRSSRGSGALRMTRSEDA